jgi:hypothetical protein
MGEPSSLSKGRLKKPKITFEGNIISTQNSFEFLIAFMMPAQIR